MISIPLLALLSVVIVSLISLIGIFTISLNTQLLKKGVFLLISLAVGALFGDAVELNEQVLFRAGETRLLNDEIATDTANLRKVLKSVSNISVYEEKINE